MEGESQRPVYEYTPHRFAALKTGDATGQSEPCICCGGTGGDLYGVCPLCDGQQTFRDHSLGGASIARADLWRRCDDSAFLLRGLLSPEECDDIVAQSEAFGLRNCGYSRRIRVTDRVSVMGEDLGRLLFERARPHLADVEVPADRRAAPGVPADLLRGLWRPEALNPCFRVCRYSPGGFFLPHHDGGFDSSDTLRSIKTFMIYLNDDFEGGPTRFYSERQPHYHRAVPEHAVYALHPEKGSCVVFNHCITHDGGELVKGAKYILRTEVMYRHVTRLKDGTQADLQDLSDSDFETEGQAISDSLM